MDSCFWRSIIRARQRQRVHAGNRAAPGGAFTEVMFVRSTDGGLTSSAPMRVNDDVNHQNKWHWFGTFAVAPNGRLDAVWYDTRNISIHRGGERKNPSFSFVTKHRQNIVDTLMILA